WRQYGRSFLRLCAGHMWREVPVVVFPELGIGVFPELGIGEIRPRLFIESSRVLESLIVDTRLEVRFVGLGIMHHSQRMERYSKQLIAHPQKTAKCHGCVTDFSGINIDDDVFDFPK